MVYKFMPLASLEPELVLLSESPFDTPDAHRALHDPEGLCAIGGDLSPERLIHLYQHGFFPWYSDPDPILWWHPAHRCTLDPEQFHTSKSLKKSLKRHSWRVTCNQDFAQVIQHCAQLREQKEGTWISPDIQNAYTKLHKLGYGHSIEVWLDQELVGGFYGVAMGQMFFGESMFSLVPNASKIALKTFCTLAHLSHIKLIDCQVASEHLESLGAKLMPRNDFLDNLSTLIPRPSKNEILLKFAHQHENLLTLTAN